LDPGQTYSCAFTVEVFGDPGTYANTVTGSGFDDDQNPVTDDGEATVEITDVLPSITVDKSADPGMLDAPGGDVEFTVVVTNDSSEAVTITSLEDDIYGTLSGDADCEVGTVLPVDGSCTFTFVGSVTGVPGDVHTNTVTATAEDNEGNEANASDDASVAIEPPPPGTPLAIDKLVGPLGTPAGSSLFVDPYTRASDETEVTWQITLTNDSDDPIYDITLTDDAAPSCVTAFEAAVTPTATGNTMAPGEVLVITCDLVVGSGPYVNTAEASGFDQYGQPIDPVSAQATTLIVAASSTIGDTVWNDANANGIQDNGEKGIAGATVKLTFPDSSTQTMNTNSNGLYLFSGLPAGTYTVELILSSIPTPTDGSLKLTTPGSFTVTLADGESFLNADFGVVATLPNTGFSSDRIALIGLALLIAGGLVLLATRRRWRMGDDQQSA
jgi:LPXTG-motif cell wall-anchored protein